MKKLVMSTVAAALLLMGAPAAHANHIQGDCRVEAVWSEAVSQPDEFSGVLVGAFADSGGRQIHVTCWIQVDGVRDTDTDLHIAGLGVARGERPVDYVAADGNVVEVCERVHLPAPTHTRCSALASTPFPPPLVGELLDLIFDIFDPIWDVTDPPDPIFCPILAGLAPGVPGLLDIEADGDVSVAGTQIWECPPYDDGGGVSLSGSRIVIQSGSTGGAP